MTNDNDSAKPKTPPIPTPPSQQEVDQISQDQALITDEWAAQPLSKGPSKS